MTQGQLRLASATLENSAACQLNPESRNRPYAYEFCQDRIRRETGEYFTITPSGVVHVVP